MIFERSLLILYFLMLVFSCKSTPTVVQNNDVVVEEEKKEVRENIDKIGDLWLDDNTYMVSAKGYPRSDAKENLRESALKAAYDLAYVKIEYAFLKEMRIRDNNKLELIRKIIDKYLIETRVEYVDERYIELTVIVKAKFLRENLRNDRLDELLN